MWSVLGGGGFATPDNGRGGGHNDHVVNQKLRSPLDNAAKLSARRHPEPPAVSAHRPLHWWSVVYKLHDWLGGGGKFALGHCPILNT